MPQATDLVLKNGAAVAKTFSLAQPASGTSSAIWYLREGANPSVYPNVEMSSQKGATPATRKVKLTVRVPVASVDSSGATRSIAAMTFDITAAVPDLVPDASRDDAIAFVSESLAASLIKASFKVGYAPT